MTFWECQRHLVLFKPGLDSLKAAGGGRRGPGLCRGRAGSGWCLLVLPLRGTGAAHEGAKTSAWWSPPMPNLLPRSSLRAGVGGRQGREGALQIPAWALLPAPSLRHGPLVSAAGAGMALRGVLDGAFGFVFQISRA